MTRKNRRFIEAITDVLDEIRKNEPLPDFVGKRIPQLESLISMLTDDEWQLPAANPEDIRLDNILIIGYLDDVIII